MSQPNDITYNRFILPPSVVSKLDVARLVRELEQLDNDLTTIAVRSKVGASSEIKPTLSDQLSDFLVANQLQLVEQSVRSQVIAQLRLLKDKAPLIHMTFATTADLESLNRLATWLRQSVHPQSLMVIGLQPSLIGGVYVRTPNQVHDLSVRARLAGARHLLVEAVEAVSGGR